MPKNPRGPARPRGGSDTMRDRGLLQVVVTFTPEEKALVRAAAGACDRPMAHWIREAAVAAALGAARKGAGKS